MTDYLRGTVEDYLEAASAGQPTPGGGSVSALAGALGATMAAMAGNFTVGKKKFADVEAEVNGLLEGLSAARRRLSDLAQKDTEAYAAVSEAFKMARKTDEEKAARKAAISAACREAMAVPLDAVRVCREALVATRRMAELANPNLITDVGVAAILLEAAGRGAALNVRVNLPSIRDSATTEQVSAELDTALGQCADLARESTELVAAAMAKGAG
jgi:formiminotetrahydrofolate cyclodeaminase